LGVSYVIQGFDLIRLHRAELFSALNVANLLLLASLLLLIDLTLDMKSVEIYCNLKKPKLLSGIILITSIVFSCTIFVQSASCSDDWTATITTSIEDKTSLTTFGVNSIATSGFDTAFDQVLEVTPPRGTEYLESCFYHSSEQPIVRYLTHSVVAPESFIWIYQVESYEIEGSIALSWSAPSIPSGYTLVLKNSASSMINDMTDVSTYSFAAQQNTLYTFTIVYSKSTNG